MLVTRLPGREEKAKVIPDTKAPDYRVEEGTRRGGDATAAKIRDHDPCQVKGFYLAGWLENN
jgi:hypothetical protein